MRVLVTGGRDYDDFQAVEHELRSLRDRGQLDIVVQGGSTGADAQAREFCDTWGVPCVTYHAAWTGLGKKAGPIRNALMLSDFQPDLVLAFPGGRGTADMVKKAKADGVEVRVIDEEPEA